MRWLKSREEEVDTVDLVWWFCYSVSLRDICCWSADNFFFFLFLNHRDNFTQALFVSLQGNASADWGSYSGKIGRWRERDSMRRIHLMSPPFYLRYPEASLSHLEEIQQNSTPLLPILLYVFHPSSHHTFFALCLSFWLKMKLF